ncbi:MAG TPA: tRNA (N(6)-L-threonylcarbamoyladenosine(37)-C(2))-methylthiotransferase MtaB [Smithellaceae bacterium]|nr:tRNA (N(6)-L-threonylcarbamoyladenosine(37)-C(2))-methylthiotransferase MtaB [Smithellaceae bacterium]HRV45797.1 tRNA (N(6)-L-threonylcarbamoyladenosine(37)-C(2))-methylthiotransferase MtaB [Smithellaceae bacterium]
MLKIGLATLGCKVNQCDSAALSENLKSAGFSLVPFNNFADAYIINTCTVTAFADFQARQLIRRALRQNPAARIVVTGCYAQTQPLLLAGMEGVAHVVGNDHKHKITELLCRPASDTPQIMAGDILRQQRFPSASASGLAGRTRAFFKIQDGCGAFCSYCIVPFARGPSRSLPFREVLEGARNFIDQGFREIVLTGIHLGDYGHDLQPRTGLVRALEVLLSNHPETRFRLSSIEPNEISDELLGLFKRFVNLCPHLHIPLQSGDDSILKSMKRGYDTAFYRLLIENIAQTAADIAVGIDVMVGFPGEGEKEFCRTMELLEKIPAAYLHVFPYSERPGTAAVELQPKVPTMVKKERAAAVRALGAKKREAFSRRFLGSVLPVLVEKTRDKHTGLAKGFSHNYLPVLLDKSAVSLVNNLVNVRIDQILDGKLIGRVLDE